MKKLLTVFAALSGNVLIAAHAAHAHGSAAAHVHPHGDGVSGSLLGLDVLGVAALGLTAVLGVFSFLSLVRHPRACPEDPSFNKLKR